MLSNSVEIALRLLDAIPATFWGVVVGAFFSLGGVALTNRATDKRQQVQLAHDRELKSRERELGLKKDIYLAAAEAVSAGLVGIGRFPNLDIPHDKLSDGYLEKSSAIAKVHVVATERTGFAIQAFTSALGASYLRLALRRAPLVTSRTELQRLNDTMMKYGKEQDQLLALMKQLNLDGLSDDRKFEVVNRNFDFAAARIAEAAKKHDELAAQLYSRQVEYLQECVAEMSVLTRLLVPAIVAIRQELDLPIDEATYRGIVESGLKTQELEMQNFLKGVQGLSAKPVVPS